MLLKTRSGAGFANAGRLGLFVAALFLAAPAPQAMAQSGGKGTGASAWAVMSGAELRTTLEGWARVAGWTLVWDSEVDYRLRASARFDGDFEKAVAQFVDAIHNTAPELRVTLYRGNRVIHVETTPVETR